MMIEGRINIETDDAHHELIVTAKVGEKTYKKNYVYLTDYTLYVVDDISGTHTDPYHYKIYFDFKLPDVEAKIRRWKQPKQKERFVPNQTMHGGLRLAANNSSVRGYTASLLLTRLQKFFNHYPTGNVTQSQTPCKLYHRVV